MKLFKKTIKNPTALELLSYAYDSATKNGGLIELTRQLRSELNKKLTHDDLISLFEHLNNDWIKVPSATGHVTFKNLVTKITIGLSGHKSDGTLNSHVKKDILDLVQNHLNVLCNEIFQYKGQNWKSRPDLTAACLRYQGLQHDQASISTTEDTSPRCA